MNTTVDDWKQFSKIGSANYSFIASVVVNVLQNRVEPHKNRWQNKQIHKKRICSSLFASNSMEKRNNEI